MVWFNVIYSHRIDGRGYYRKCDPSTDICCDKFCIAPAHVQSLGVYTLWKDSDDKGTLITMSSGQAMVVAMEVDEVLEMLTQGDNQ